MNKVAQLLSPFGNLFVAFNEKGISGSALIEIASLKDFCKKVENRTGVSCQETDSFPKHLTDGLCLWSDRNDSSKLTFDLTNSTSFQQEVWRACQQIPAGSTVSYSELASTVGKPKAVRAVGSALGANPFLILVPCHRVLRSNGELGGFAGGLDLKLRLLQKEGAK
tara:strand:+ start:7188 stop:7685 length:498 start_codon:yes stop_codon:yes gene_type:complete